jgi:hypothetical protein
VSGVAGAAAISVGLIGPSDLPGMVARGVLALGVTLACGALVPYSEQQPLSAVAGGVLAAVCYMLVTLSSGLMTQQSPPGSDAIMTAAAAALALMAYVMLAARHRRGPVRRS